MQFCIVQENITSDWFTRPWRQCADIFVYKRSRLILGVHRLPVMNRIKEEFWNVAHPPVEMLRFLLLATFVVILAVSFTAQMADGKLQTVWQYYFLFVNTRTYRFEAKLKLILKLSLFTAVRIISARGKLHWKDMSFPYGVRTECGSAPVRILKSNVFSMTNSSAHCCKKGFKFQTIPQKK